MIIRFSFLAENKKFRRKETWEKLKKRHADKFVTAPIECDQCQKVSGRPIRPNRLPLTCEYHLEKMIFELPSPTAISLNGNDLATELACKSSSAPHLIKSTQTLPKTKYERTEVFILF